MPSSLMQPKTPEHERAHRSLAALRPKLNRRPVSVSPSGRRVLESSPERNRGAVDGLRQLLQEHNPNLWQEPVDNRPAPSAASRPLPNPEEAVGIIQHQSAYIRQLESELKLTQGELTTYKTHLNDLLEENSRLGAAQQTSAILQDALNKSKGDNSTSSPATKQSLSKHINDLELLKALHTSKTEILEQQLAATKEALYAAQQKAEEHKSKLLIQESLSEFDRTGTRKGGGVCLRCGQKAGLIAAHCDPTSLVHQLTEEKNEMIETLSNIKRQLVDMQEREFQAVEKVKVGIQITEQANTEKAQALLEREQMAEELSALKQRCELLINEHKTTLKNAKMSARTEVKNEISEMERRLKQTTESNSQLQVQLERTLREKDAASSELLKHKNELAIYQSSMVESTTGRRIDLTQLACERDMAVEEKNKLRNRIIKVEQVKDESILRVKKELEDVRNRLDAAERDVIQSREETVKLTRFNQDLEKQLNQAKMAFNNVDRSRNDELHSLTRKLESREDELQRVITDTEARYSKQLNEMENMYVAQNNVVEQLKQECHSQADIIENLSTKYRRENKQLKHDNMVCNRQLGKCKERLKVMDGEGMKNENVHRKLRERVAQLDEENYSLARQTNEMVAKTSEYKREVEILAAEVKFLRCQVGGGGDTSAHRANTAVVDGILNALKADMVSQDANITGSIDILRQVSTP